MAIPADKVSGEVLYATEVNDMLAELRAIKARQQVGTVTISIAAATNGSATVTFPVAFSTAPRVTATVTGASVFVASTSAVTTSGCTIAVRHIDGTSVTNNVTVHWQASVNV